MFKKVLLQMIKSRADINPVDMAVNGFLLVLIAALVGALFEVPLLTATLRRVSLIVIWICAGWIWADNIFLNSKRAWLRDRRKDIWPH